MRIRTEFPLADTVDRAFECLYWEGAGDEQVEAFASHWGGLDLEHFQQALQSGEGDEQLLAIFALGLTATAEAADLIAPFLYQAPRRQRWASAICLGLMKDPRAFPILEALLLDGLDLEEYRRASQEEDWDSLFELDWCGTFRWHGIQCLEGWETPSLLSTLKQAFAALWRMQQDPHPFRFAQVANYDALAYALGQRGDFTVLEGLDLPREHRNTAMIYLALGHLGARASGGFGLTGLPGPLSEMNSELVSNQELREAVSGELASHFGLSVEEQADCLRHFLRYADLRAGYGQLASPFPDDFDEDDQGNEGDEQEMELVMSSPLCAYQDHTARIQCLAWSSESIYLVSGSEDGTARVWNSMTGETVTVFRGHTASVNQVTWSPQGRLIASGGSDRVVCVWDAWTGEQVNLYQGHDSWLWGGLAWSPDGAKIASASLDRTVQVWDALSGKTLLTYRGHSGMVASLSWSPNGTQIISGGGYPECSIQIWDAQTGALQLTYRDHERDVNRQRPLFGLILQEYDEHTENWLREASSVHSLAWSPDGTRIASAGLRTVCRVWDARSGENIVASDRTEGPLAWSPDGVSLVSPRFGHQVDVWDATTNRISISYHTPKMSDIKALGWSPDGRFLAASGRTTTPYGRSIIQVWRSRFA